MPLWRLYFNKISLYLQSIIAGHPIHSNCNFGTNCPKPFPSNMALVVYPSSPHIVQNSRELSVKGAQHRRFCGGLPLTGGTGCSISRRRGGGISSRAASFPMTGKGRGDWVEYMRMEMSRNVQSGNTTRRSIELRPGRGCGIRRWTV